MYSFLFFFSLFDLNRAQTDRISGKILTRINGRFLLHISFYSQRLADDISKALRRLVIKAKTTVLLAGDDWLSKL